MRFSAQANWKVVFDHELRHGNESLLAGLEAEIAPVDACVRIIG